MVNAGARFRDLVEGHALCHSQLEIDRRTILSAFPQFINEGAWSRWHFALRRFAEDAPFRYLDIEVVSELLDLFAHDSAHLVETLEKEEVRVNHAVFSALRPRIGWQDEKSIGLSETRDVLRLDRVIHPDYIHYVEHIYQNLIRVVMAALSRKTGNDQMGGNLPDWCERLDELGFASLTRGYDRTVRNALSHGGVNYQEHDIEYVDWGGEKTLRPSQVGRIHDDMVDTCSALLFALILTLARNGPQWGDNKFRRLPLGLSYLHLEANHRHPGIRVDRLADGDFPGRGRQLIVYATSATDARRHHILEGLCLAAKAVGGCRGRYKRIGVVIDSGRGISGAWFVPAKPIEDAFASNADLGTLQGQLGDSMLLWHDTTPLRARLYTIEQVFRLGLKRFPQDMAERMKAQNADVTWMHYRVKSAEKASSGSYRRWFVHAIVPDPSWQTEERLQAIGWDVVARYAARPLRGFDLTREVGPPLPPAEIVVHLYKTDRRMRNIGFTQSGERNEIKLLRWKSPLASLQGPREGANDKASPPNDAP